MSREKYFEAYETAMALCPTPDAVPSLSGTSACWAPLLPALDPRHPVYTVDTLGEPGASVQTTPLTGTADEVSWLGELLQRLELTGIHLVGGSAGGWHATNHAIHRPDRLASVTLLEPPSVTAGYAKASGIPPQTRPTDDDLRSIRVPMLAVFGELAVVQDSVAAAAHLRTLLPHAEVELWPDAGHGLYFDQDDADRVLDFVRETSSGEPLPR